MGNTEYTLNTYCRNYRKHCGVTLDELCTDCTHQALSAYERGLSNNTVHFIKYIKLAKSRGELLDFLHGINDLFTCEVVNNGN